MIRALAASDADTPAFEQFFTIYAASLPVREQKSRQEIASLLTRPDYVILVLEEAGDVVAFSVLYRSSTEPFCLLEYMATQPGLRNSGRGAVIFRAGLDAMPGRSMVVEVDSDREAAPDRALRIRRKTFYRRLGCLQVEGLNYEMPLPGEGRPPEMDLLVQPNGRDTPIALSQLRAWLSDIYSQVYAQAPNDPRIEAMLAELPKEIHLV